MHNLGLIAAAVIDQHLDEVAEIKDQAADKNAKAAKKGKP